jgi:hypothetical protein
MKPVSIARFISGAGLIWSPGQLQHVRDRIDHRTDHPSAHVEHDHHRETVVFDLLAAQLDAQVHHRHDHPAQVHHPLDEVRCIGNARGLLVRADLLHPQDVDPVFLRAQAETQVFGGALAGSPDSAGLARVRAPSLKAR